METEKVVIVKKNNLLFKMFFYSVVGTLLGGLCVWGVVLGVKQASIYTNKVEEYVGIKVHQTKDFLGDSLGIVKVVTVETNIPDEDIKIKIDKYASTFGLNEIVPMAVADKESKMDQFRWRYEQTWYDSYHETRPAPSHYNPEEIKMYYASIGIMQISYPIWKEFCGVTHPMQLFNIDTNIKCGVRILADCLHKNRSVQKNADRLRICYTAYNGSGLKAERYASDVMSMLVNYTIEDKALLSEMVQTLKAEDAKVENQVIENKKAEEVLIQEEKKKVEMELQTKISMLNKNKKTKARL